MTAPELYPLSEFTPEQAAKVAEFEAAETPPEVLREQVARALSLHEYPANSWNRQSKNWREHYLRLADAALAVFRGQQDPAVQLLLRRVHEWYYAEREICGFATDTEPPCVKSYGHDGDHDGTYDAPWQERFTAWADHQIAANRAAIGSVTP